MLKLCLCGPYTNFNLATAIWETNIFQNCRGLLAEKSAITRELCLRHKLAFIKTGMAMPSNLRSYHLSFIVDCFLSLSCHPRKTPKGKKNPEGWKKTTSLRYAKQAQLWKSGMKMIKHYRSSTVEVVSMLSNLSWYKTKVIENRTQNLIQLWSY